MRNWNLIPGDPVELTLAADFRLCATDYINDQIWELEIGGGDPPALAMHTTYGLRARTMRLFPRFTLGSQVVTDPAAFAQPPHLHRFFPNFLQLDFSPFPNLDVISECWVPDSHTAAGRFTITNQGSEPLDPLLEICGQLVPLDGKSLAPFSMHSTTILAGHTSNLAPVLFLTGGPQAGPGTYPSLSLKLSLPAGGSRSLTWVHAALATLSDSYEAARHTASRPWEAEYARIERVNTAQAVEIQTGDPDWDAALALSQKAAFGLFFSPGQFLPCPSFVMARQPDHGYSPRGDGHDYAPLWSGQSPLEAYYMAGLLPGAPRLAAGLVRNFLAAQNEEGSVDWKPGLAGQRGRWMAAPLLASLAWQTYIRTLDTDFLGEIQPGLDAFVRCWFIQQHDRDLDGFPEWDHPLQTGLEDLPAFTVWNAGGQGAAISAAESPALSAMLARETLSLAKIARALSPPKEYQQLETRTAALRLLTDECWDDSAVLYHYRDRDSHRSPAGRSLGKHSGDGKLVPGRSFPQSVRLLVKIRMKGEFTRRPEITLHGSDGESPQSERLERSDFQWCTGLAVATSRQRYSGLDEVEISGIEKHDQVSIHIMDFTSEDITLFLPLWGEVPDPTRARTLISRTLLADDRFGGVFGIPTCAKSTPINRKKSTDFSMDPTCQAVQLPWNSLIGEGLLAYGLREEAAQLTTRLMAAVIQNLKRQHAFFRAYHSETGVGLGERNAVQGLAPLGLFLEALGIEIQSEKKVTLSGRNPFPWPVTVKYRGLTVKRQVEQTLIVFPDGQALTLNDPTDAVVSCD